ncbi:AAA family ATPase [Mangrovibacterium diazotrophicum]|uniref:MoxR-like ATPase n=1 Tax=Mangrovibacterium diazotrophicum TaxID=1261403 RepID=A0A419VXF8_9BACT|nr:MoxR family ATPase [Mangrovibacterium diazotrophicum]RKD87908.1 MoxR-like ATPase [Mangrovibacterium diazotrophicum]
MEENTLFENRTDFSSLSAAVEGIRAEIKKVIVGQDRMIDLLIVAMLTNGHSLIEGVPGVAKTLAARLLAKSVDTNFSRIQFTPDLMPSDVLGTSVYNMGKGEFQFKKGPVFSNLVLIDEINRAPAKTQSALFEVMEERQVSVDGISHPMQAPFLVFATQNPVEHEGTYRLPEAQLDRFLFKINVDYPSVEEEEDILNFHDSAKDQVKTEVISPVVTAEQLVAFQKQIFDVQIESGLKNYIARIVTGTRNHKDIYLGASPRASIHLMNAAKAVAAIEGRDFVTPADIKEVTVPVLAHRIILSPEKEMEGFRPEEMIQLLVQSIEVPR